MTARCCKCGDDANERTGWQKVTGWERARQQGGTNHVALRKKLNVFMCNGCMVLSLSGISTEQMTIE